MWRPGRGWPSPSGPPAWRPYLMTGFAHGAAGRFEPHQREKKKKQSVHRGNYHRSKKKKITTSLRKEETKAKCTRLVKYYKPREVSNHNDFTFRQCLSISQQKSVAFLWQDPYSHPKEKQEPKNSKTPEMEWVWQCEGKRGRMFTF